MNYNELIKFFQAIVSGLFFYFMLIICVAMVNGCAGLQSGTIPQKQGCDHVRITGDAEIDDALYAECVKEKGLLIKGAIEGYRKGKQKIIKQIQKAGE